MSALDFSSEIFKGGGPCGFPPFASSLGWHDDKAGAAGT